MKPLQSSFGAIGAVALMLVGAAAHSAEVKIGSVLSEENLEMGAYSPRAPALRGTTRPGLHTLPSP
jgi:hypothetical protein